jgi:hypothetical protein
MGILQKTAFVWDNQNWKRISLPNQQTSWETIRNNRFFHRDVATFCSFTLPLKQHTPLTIQPITFFILIKNTKISHFPVSLAFALSSGLHSVKSCKPTRSYSSAYLLYSPTRLSHWSSTTSIFLLKWWSSAVVRQTSANLPIISLNSINVRHSCCWCDLRRMF